MDGTGVVVLIALGMAGVGIVRALLHMSGQVDSDSGRARRVNGPRRREERRPPKPARPLPEGLVEMQLPELTTLTGTRSVASHSDEGVSYELDLDARTCTCRNFVDGRAQRDPSSIGRLCKHLGEVAALDPALQTDTLLTALVQRNYGAAHFYRTSLPNGAVVAIGYTPGGEWVDVFARDRVEGDRRGTGSGPYERFGFNRRERRWSYGEGPPGATVLRELLRKLPT